MSVVSDSSCAVECVDQMHALGTRVAEVARAGEVFALNGDLGCGKTEFVRGFMKRLNADALVRSPSFALLYTYPAPAFLVHHFDFYRLQDPSELYEIGFEEYLATDAVCLIEWAGLFPEVLPESRHTLRFFDTGRHRRNVELSPGLAEKVNL